MFPDPGESPAIGIRDENRCTSGSKRLKQFICGFNVHSELPQQFRPGCVGVQACAYGLQRALFLFGCTNGTVCTHGNEQNAGQDGF
jgi:hypothetical protein